MSNKLISIVIPVYNEEKNINRTIEELLDLTKSRPDSFEIIAINDGSTDKSWEVIKDFSSRFQEIHGINLMTNFGQSAAYQAGFDFSKGEYVITVSADLEIPLDNVNRVIAHLDDGYDLVNTNRVGRFGKERAVKSGAANRLFINPLSGVSIKDRGSGMKGLSRVIVDNLKLYGEMHRFIPDFASVYGARIIEFDVDFKDRDYGVSYYKGHKRTIKVLLDLVTLGFMLYFAKKPFTSMPGRLFGFTGAVIAGFGVLGGVYLSVLKILGESIGSRPLLILSALLIIVGIQSIMMGMIGELTLRIYFESTKRKTYAIRNIIR